MVYNKVMLIKYEWLAVYRLFLGVVAVVAIAVQLVSIGQVADYQLVSFLSLFAVQSGILVAGLLIAVGMLMLLGSREDLPRLALFRGAATLYAFMAGIFYILPVSEPSLQLLPWVEIMLHYIIPIAVMTDWLVFTPHFIPTKKAMIWLLFPAIYVIYGLIRSFFDEGHSHSFLNGMTSDYISAIWAAVLVMVCAGAFAWLLAKMTHTTREKRLF